MGLRGPILPNMIRTIAGLLVVLASVSVGCAGATAPEVPQSDELGEVVATTTEEVKDGAACTIALAEEALACGTAAAQAGVDPPNDAACAIAFANAVHECQP